MCSTAHFYVTAARAALSEELGAAEFTLKSNGGVAITGAKGKAPPSSVVIPARFSNQLVPEDEDPCRVDNGGCDAMVTCAADPSDPAGRECGACPAGYAGLSTEKNGCVDIDECATDNGGCFKLTTCVNSAGGRLCGACPAGYTGDGVTCVDVDECLEDNGGCDPLTKCENQPGSSVCTACPPGYKGEGATGCKLESGCSVNNGGCDPLSNCTDLGKSGKSSCGPCPAGYSGDGTSGCVDIDGCVVEPCASGVHCVDVPAPATGRSCGACPPGQVGDGVTCRVNPCFTKNGGCDALTSCRVDVLSPGGRVCSSCPKGYAGSGLAGCEDLDACLASPCFAGVTCTDLPPPSEERRCGPCPPGYSGDGVTCTDVDECAVDNGGCDLRTKCTNIPGSHTCGDCPAGMMGNGYAGCVEPSACATNNGGCDARTNCTDAGGGGTTCDACPAGFSGTGATGCVDIDGCADSPCYPGVVCADTPAPGLPAPGYECGVCPEGMRGNGTHCERCAITARVLASTVVDGLVKRSADLRIVAGLSLMTADCTNTKVGRCTCPRNTADPVVDIEPPSFNVSNPILDLLCEIESIRCRSFAFKMRARNSPTTTPRGTLSGGAR